MFQNCKMNFKNPTSIDCRYCDYLTECRNELIKKNASQIDNIHTNNINSALNDIGDKYYKMEEKYTGGCVTNIFFCFLFMLLVYAIGMIFGG